VSDPVLLWQYQHIAAEFFAKAVSALRGVCRVVFAVDSLAMVVGQAVVDAAPWRLQPVQQRHI
jgi:hypothetical protein